MEFRLRDLQTNLQMIRVQPVQLWGNTAEQRVAASTLRRYSSGLRLAIAQADASHVVQSNVDILPCFGNGKLRPYIEVGGISKGGNRGLIVIRIRCNAGDDIGFGYIGVGYIGVGYIGVGHIVVGHIGVWL